MQSCTKDKMSFTTLAIHAFTVNLIKCIDVFCTTLGAHS